MLLRFTVLSSFPNFYPTSPGINVKYVSKWSGRLPVSYYRSLRFGKLRISAKFKFIYLLFLPRSDLSSVIRSMTAGLRKFILLSCNSLFLENNVISTNDIALNSAGWREFPGFVLDWENRIEFSFSVAGGPPCSKFSTLTIDRTFYKKIILTPCVDSH